MPTTLDAWRPPVPGVAAHRGGRALGPENTLIGIMDGLAAGATHLEIDVRGTADDVPVMMHDETAQRTCLDEGIIEEMTLEEVKQLDPCVLWSEHAGIATGERDPPSDTPRTWYQVPTLSEVLEAIPGVPVILDLKDTAPTEAVAEVVSNAWRRPEDLVLAGYDDDVLDQVAERIPSFPRGAGYDGTQAFYGGQDVEADVIFVPPEHEGLELIQPEMIERAHEMHAGFWVWTINSAEEARALLDMGVDGLITDDPGKLSTERIRRMD